MTDVNKETFKDRLLDELSYAGISNKEFAASVGISINTLNMYLYRNSIPAADVAVKMANYLNTTVEHLISGGKQKRNVSANTRKKQEIDSILNQLDDIQMSSLLDIVRAYFKALVATEQQFTIKNGRIDKAIEE